MIVVEGPDGAGKTTLINQLTELTGLSVAPRVVSKDAEAMVDLVKWTEVNVSTGFQKVIFDRHRLISEPIYGPILRDKPQPGFSDPQWFYHQLRAFYELDPIIIYCLPPYKTVYDNVKHDPDNKVVSGGIEMRLIWGAYFSKAMTDHVLHPSTWVYDYTQTEFADLLVKHIARQINKRIE